jgi:hypothetical protein
MEAPERLIRYTLTAVVIVVLVQVIVWVLQQVTQKLTITHLGSGTMTADGSEQRVFALDRAEPFKIEGYIDLSNMKTGDEVIIRQYVKIRPDGELKKYWEEKYNGIQANPVYYLTPKPSVYGILITLQQTSGTYISYDWEFYMAVT